MIPELGHLALALALGLAAAQAALGLAGGARRDPAWIAAALGAARGQALMAVVAFTALTWAAVRSDFTVLYLAQNSNSQLPLLYKVTGVWGAHEGSLLLWGMVLALWGAAVAVQGRRALPASFLAHVVGVLGLVGAGFLAFMLLTSNPFERLWPPPPEGRDLNPLLQDPGLAAHPPLLYMGYVGLAVPFAFAVAALLEGRMEAAWLRWARPWTTVAWVFLTLGIAIGSWWAYYELGWGGWWFWDPVENASLMPWLVATALLHSLAVSEKRGAFKGWTVLLAVLGFALSLLGTFLVRSGVLTSVHAFASDPTRGVFILALLAVVVGGSLLLYALRGDALAASDARFAAISREGALLANNVLLLAAAGAVLLGTLYPLVLEALGGAKISVGPPYFNAVFLPLVAPLVLLTAAAGVLRWKRDRLGRVARALWPAALAGLVAGAAAVPLAREVLVAAAGVALAGWLAGGVGVALWQRARHQGLRALARMGRAEAGMHLAHLGLAVVTVGVSLAGPLEQARDVRMGAGDVARLGGYEFRLEGFTQVRGPNYEGVRAQVRVLDAGDGRTVAVLHPEKRRYLSSGGMPMTEAGIASGLFRDLYVSLGEPIGDSGDWAVRVHVKPFVRWIWGGSLLMAIGGLWAAGDRRYRMRARAAAAAAAAEEPA